MFANITKNSSIIASVVALSVGLGACGPAATVQKKPVGPSPEELARLEEQRKQAEKDQMLKDDLARSLQKREVVVQEIEFVPGVDVEAQKKFREGVIALYSTMDYDLAKQSFEQAVALDKNFLEAYFNLGMIYERTGQREAAIKVSVHRLRQRYRELLRAVIADTVDGPEEVEDELRHLFRVLAG